jgi:hypothetical protein
MSCVTPRELTPSIATTSALSTRRFLMATYDAVSSWIRLQHPGLLGSIVTTAGEPVAGPSIEIQACGVPFRRIKGRSG